MSPGARAYGDAGPTEAGGRPAALLVLALLGIYALLVGAPMIPGIPPVVGGVVVTIVFAFAALGAAAQVARLELPAWVELTGLVIGVFDWYLLASAGSLTDLGRFLIVPAADVLLLFVLMLGGRLLSRLLREPKMLLPVALVLVMADVYTVYFGFTGAMLEKAPEVVESVSVKLPEFGSATGPEGVAGLRHIATMGPGDTFFAAVFFAVIVRFALGLRRSFCWIFGIVAAVLAIVVALPEVPPIPVLPLMALGFVVPNWRQLRLSGAEWAYVAIVAVFVTALFAGMSYLMGTVLQ